MIDHVVYGVDDLKAGVDELTRRLGVRAAAGGKHLGRGTHNALLALGGETYLEIIAPDPDQPRTEGLLPFGLDRMKLPRLVGWAGRSTDLDAQVNRAREHGYDPGQVEAMSRQRPDGTVLEWRLTRHVPDPERIAQPFLIDWGTSPHPSKSAPAGVRLVELRAQHPDPGHMRSVLAALGLDLRVDEGPESALVAVLDSPKGRVVLR
jgi:hypothetical protein